MNDEPSTEEQAPEPVHEPQPADAGGAMLTIPRRLALWIGAAFATVIILLATALVIEADGDRPEDFPPIEPRGFSFNSGPGSELPGMPPVPGGPSAP